MKLKLNEINDNANWEYLSYRIASITLMYTIVYLHNQSLKQTEKEARNRPEDKVRILSILIPVSHLKFDVEHDSSNEDCWIDSKLKYLVFLDAWIQTSSSWRNKTQHISNRTPNVFLIVIAAWKYDFLRLGASI